MLSIVKVGVEKIVKLLCLEGRYEGPVLYLSGHYTVIEGNELHLKGINKKLIVI